MDSGDRPITVAGSASPAASGSMSHSGDSGKSVSFLVPPKHSVISSKSTHHGSDESLPSVFANSPTGLNPLSSIANQEAISSKPEYPGKSDIPRDTVHALEHQAEKMDVDLTPSVDNPEEAKRKSLYNSRFGQHRDTSVMSFDSTSSEGPRRPSLNSAYASSSNVSRSRSRQDALLNGIGRPTPISKTHEPPRESTLFTKDGLSPIATVLEGMRTQRMSLVQSLRQYIFVHRGELCARVTLRCRLTIAIIQGYLDIIDDEKRHERATSESNDDTHQKRRASPTELVPEAVTAEVGGANLSKRPSFKKMRPARPLPDLKMREGTPTVPEGVVVDTPSDESPNLGFGKSSEKASGQ